MEKEKTYTTEQIKTALKYKSQQKLLKLDIDPNLRIDDTEKRTALMEAAFKGYTKLVKLMVTKGPDLELRSNDDNYMYYSNGLNAFHYACLSGKSDTVEALLNAGAEINSVCQLGRNGLMYACFEGHYKLVSFLHKKGIDINAQDNKGMNALIFAYKKKIGDFDYDLNLIHTLVDLGVDLDLKDKEGQTALSHYVKRDEFWMTQRLSEKGADPNAPDINILSVAENIFENSYLMMMLLKEYGAKEKPYWVEMEASIECSECNRNVHVNSPVKKVQCPECLSYTKIPDKFWTYIFERSKEFNNSQIQELGNRIMKKADPCCLSCGESLDLINKDIKSTAFLECNSCGQKNILSEPPDWFQSFMISYRHPVKVLCDRYKAIEKIDDDKPVVLKCTSCAAVLSVTNQTLTNFKCEHCNAEQQLPEEVWRALHSGNKRKTWYIFSEYST